MSAEPGIALVELFTSEGCSSCPPADVLLSQIDAEAREQDQPIYVLAWHVDYWDRLGWVDPWANPDFSERQRAYGEQLDCNAYTPQMVVNGKAQVLGSDSGAARTEIRRALAAPAETGVELHGLRFDGQRVSATLAAPAPAGTLVQAALVERNLVSSVARGENEGLTLNHDGVVRAFRTFEPGDRVELVAPNGLDPVHTSLVVFVQEPVTLRVLGATAAELP